MKILDYTTSRATPFHLLGGVISSLLVGSIMAGIMFFSSIIIYQIYDSLPMESSCWNHTKWDVLEVGFGAGLMGGVIMVLGLVL